MAFFKKYGWLAVAVMVCLALLAVVQRQNLEIQNLKDRLSITVDELGNSQQEQWRLSRECAALREELARAEAERSVVSSYALEVRGVEPGNLLVDVSLKLDLADRNATVVIKTRKEHPLTRQADGTYTGQVALPLIVGTPETLTLHTSAGGVKRSEVLARYSSVTELLPVHVYNAAGEALYSEPDGKFSFADWSLEVRDGSGKSAEITDPVLRVYRNGGLVLETPCRQSEQRPGQYWGDGDGLDCRDGDTIEFRFACTDRFGLGYEFSMNWWEIRDGQSIQHWPTTAYPTLTWPE